MMGGSWSKYGDIAIFVMAVYVLTWLFILSGNEALLALSQITPLLGVLILLLCLPNRKHRFRQLGLQRTGKVHWSLAAIGLVIPVAISFFAAWTAGLVRLPDLGVDRWAYIAETARMWHSPLFLLMPFLFALGEEVGWRGFLQSRLTEETGAISAVLWTAAAWAGFHLPFFMIGYNDDGSLLVTVALFVAMLFPLSVIMGWLRVRSGSVWPVVALHTLVNQQRHFWADIFMVKIDGWTYVAGESGIVTIVCWLIIGSYMFRNFVPDKASLPGHIVHGRD